MDPLSGREEVAHGVLCSLPKPGHFFFSPRNSSERRGIEIFCRTSRRHTFDLDTEYTHGQRASRRARPVNIDGDLRNFMWIHGLGGERLLVMSYALCPNPKNAYFLPSEMDRDLSSLGWVGAPNERAPLRVHGAIAVSAARCLRTRIADQGLGGFHEHCAGFARATKFRVSCPGEFKICRPLFFWRGVN